MNRKSKSTFYYEIEVYVTTFQKDPNKTKPYTDTTRIYINDYKCITEAKEIAYNLYYEKCAGIGESYFLPFQSPAEFIMGKGAASSIRLALVEVYQEIDVDTSAIIFEDHNHNYLEGEDEVDEGLELQEYLINQLK